MARSALATTDVEVLRKGLQGEVVLPADGAYDQARTLWNGSFDRHPAMIVRCRSAEDVSATITFARLHDLEIAVRGGAHNTGGLSGVDDGLVIDLSLMDQVETDVAGRRCRVGGGATLARRDIATQEHGLATTAGIVGHTGVGGLALTGGMGWLTRRHGLALDNVLSVEIVTADGKIRRASADQEPDLFWAVRGGGGNFGVVTEFEFRLHDVGPIVDFGLLFWPLAQGAEVLRLARDLFASMSRDTNMLIAAINAPPAPFVPVERRGTPGYALVLTGFGRDGEHGRIVERIGAELPPLIQVVAPMPYAAVQQTFDEANRFGLLAYDKAAYVEDLTDEVIAIINEQVAQKARRPRRRSPTGSTAPTARSTKDDTPSVAAAQRGTRCSYSASPRATPTFYATETRWVRDFRAALQPVAMGSGSYLNGEAEYAEDRGCGPATALRSTPGWWRSRAATTGQRLPPQRQRAAGPAAAAAAERRELVIPLNAPVAPRSPGHRSGLDVLVEVEQVARVEAALDLQRPGGVGAVVRCHLRLR